MNRPDLLGHKGTAHVFIGNRRNSRTSSVVDSGSDRDLRLHGRSGALEHAPRETPLLIHARSRSARTVDGWVMFTKQAERQFRLWHTD